MSTEISEAVKAVARQFGCGDNSCMFGPPGGMGTNGGCRCLNELRNVPVRARVSRGIYALRALLARASDKPADDDGPCRAAVKSALRFLEPLQADAPDSLSRLVETPRAAIDKPAEAATTDRDRLREAVKHVSEWVAPNARFGPGNIDVLLAAARELLARDEGATEPNDPYAAAPRTSAVWEAPAAPGGEETGATSTASEERAQGATGLLPCPFCGSTPKLADATYRQLYVVCGECGASSEYSSSYGVADLPTRAEAEAEVRGWWNRRRTVEAPAVNAAQRRPATASETCTWFLDDVGGESVAPAVLLHLQVDDDARALAALGRAINFAVRATVKAEQDGMAIVYLPIGDVRLLCVAAGGYHRDKTKETP